MQSQHTQSDGKINVSAYCPVGDPCPMCNAADLARHGNKDICPNCNYVQPCCQP